MVVWSVTDEAIRLAVSILRSSSRGSSFWSINHLRLSKTVLARTGSSRSGSKCSANRKSLLGKCDCRAARTRLLVYCGDYKCAHSVVVNPTAGASAIAHPGRQNRCALQEIKMSACAFRRGKPKKRKAPPLPTTGPTGSKRPPLRRTFAATIKRPSGHAAGQEAADRNPDRAPHRPYHGPAGAIWFSDYSIAGDVDPLAPEPYAVVAVLQFPMTSATTEPSASEQHGPFPLLRLSNHGMSAASVVNLTHNQHLAACVASQL